VQFESLSDELFESMLGQKMFSRKSRFWQW